MLAYTATVASRPAVFIDRDGTLTEDHVVVFDEDTADRLVASLRPHVHAKGTDYTAASVAEAAAARSIGAAVAIAGDPKSHSTRDLIGLIVERFAPSR